MPEGRIPLVAFMQLGNDFKISARLLSSEREFRTWGEIAEFTSTHTALLDFDGPKAIGMLNLFGICRLVGLRPIWTQYRRTKRGWHCIIRFHEPLLPAEIVALQAVCGSDPKREALNLARVRSCYNHHGKKRWNILYRVKLER